VLGLVPNVSLRKINSVGNATGLGSQMALMSIYARKESERIACEAEAVELSGRVDFQRPS